MALDYTQLTAVTQEIILPTAADNFYNATPVLKRLQKRSRKYLRGGKNIQVTIMYQGQTASGTFSGWGTLSTTVNDVLTAVTYNWGH